MPPTLDPPASRRTPGADRAPLDLMVLIMMSVAMAVISITLL